MSLLGTLIDFKTALEADRLTPLEQKKTRDRHLGTQVQQWRRQPHRQIHAWLELVAAQAEPRGQQAAQLAALMGLLLAVAGLMSGWGLAQVVLHYDGVVPINLVNVLAVLVLPQLLLLLVWLLVALPMPLPGLQALRDALRYFNPGRLGHLLAKRFGHGGGGLEILWQREHAVVLAPSARWLLSFWSQLFAVLFNLGLLLALFYLVSFSDLAFGWSTTLEWNPGRFHSAVQTLAWPWHAWFPSAVPDASLVEVSRFYRLAAHGNGNSTQAARLGDWWPFVAMAITTYGLLPRLVTLVLSWQRLHHHLRTALPRLPGAPELLSRMNNPLVSTAASQPEIAATSHAAGSSVPAAAAHYALRCEVVTWSHEAPASVLNTELQALGIDPVRVMAAGGGCSTEQDRATIESLCNAAAVGVAVVAKAWEPPLLEFLDFLQAIRRRCGVGRPIVVALTGGGRPVQSADRAVWEQTLSRLEDPDLHVEQLRASP